MRLLPVPAHKRIERHLHALPPPRCAAFVQLDHTRALSAGHRSVAATFSLTVFDQGEGGRDFVAVFDCEGGHPAPAAAAGPAPSSADSGGTEGGSLPSAGAPREGCSTPVPGTPGRGTDGTAPSSSSRAVQRRR